MNLAGKRVLVVGTGVSGIAAAELLLALGADTVLYDSNEKLCEADIRAKSEKLKNISILLGDLQETDMKQFAVAVLSPGVPTDSPIAEKLRAHQVELWGEIELAYRFGKGRVAAITGTNGKTTTTALTGEIMKSQFADVKVVGNIGIPYTSLAAQMTEDTVTVAEISSFQLETIDTFAPKVSAILNITPDHLNRHHTMECYIAMKQSIVKNQKPGDACVLNYEDLVLREFGEDLLKKGIRVIYFSSKRELSEGLYLKDGRIYVADQAGIHMLVHVEELNLLGVHNYENVMAAAGISLAFAVPMEKISEVLKTFQAVEHRIEYAGEINGVRYYNDSKATNPDAAIQGIRAMNRQTYLIGGGYDKQSEYGTWIDAFDGKVRKLVLIGATKEKIEQTARERGFSDIVKCDSFEEAVRYCHRYAQPGEAVLLSPACASWDMFENYEQRGKVFKEIVRGFQKE